jgi:hypothetical protein
MWHAALLSHFVGAHILLLERSLDLAGVVREPEQTFPGACLHTLADAEAIACSSVSCYVSACSGWQVFVLLYSCGARLFLCFRIPHWGSRRRLVCVARDKEMADLMRQATTGSKALHKYICVGTTALANISIQQWHWLHYCLLQGGCCVCGGSVAAAPPACQLYRLLSRCKEAV